jgi:hypothetical protein
VGAQLQAVAALPLGKHTMLSIAWVKKEIVLLLPVIEPQFVSQHLGY